MWPYIFAMLAGSAAWGFTEDFGGGLVVWFGLSSLIKAIDHTHQADTGPM